jgi:ABC-2 type transport system permease protein
MQPIYVKSLTILFVTTQTQLKLLGRSWFARLSDLLIPSAVAFVPILLTRGIAGDELGLSFAHYAHTSNYAGFVLIGGGAFLLVTRAFWGFGNWMREEMQSGALESLYLTPASMALILAGVALAFMIYSGLIFVGAMVVGALMFQIVFQTHYLPLALIFLGIGLPAIYSMALLYGTLVLQLKETEAFIQIAQWLTTLLMGVYFPVSLLPAALRFTSLVFPPTWLTQGLRSTLLDIPYLSNHWAIDLAVLACFSLIGPVLAYLTFSKVEQSLRKSSGLGKF